MPDALPASPLWSHASRRRWGRATPSPIGRGPARCGCIRTAESWAAAPHRHRQPCSRLAGTAGWHLAASDRRAPRRRTWRRSTRCPGRRRRYPLRASRRRSTRSGWRGHDAWARPGDWSRRTSTSDTRSFRAARGPEAAATAAAARSKI
eukprot:1468985-Prymnesium_polylepis.2